MVFIQSGRTLVARTIVQEQFGDKGTMKMCDLIYFFILLMIIKIFYMHSLAVYYLKIKLIIIMNNLIFTYAHTFIY